MSDGLLCSGLTTFFLTLAHLTLSQPVTESLKRQVCFQLSFLNFSRLMHCVSVPSKYAKRVCNGLAQLGARGVSLTFSSGDFGVGDGESDPDAHICYTNDGKNTTRFMPTFPA